MLRSPPALLITALATLTAGGYCYGMKTSGSKTMPSMGQAVNRMEQKKKSRCGKIVQAARKGDMEFLMPGGEPLSEVKLRRLKINCVDQHGYTPLHHAARKGNLDFLVKLIDLGANLEGIYAETGWTSLHEAAYWGKAAVVKTLVDRGAEVNSIASKTKETPLHAACQGLYGNQAPIVKVLLDAGATESLSVVDSNGLTALHHAARNECVACVRTLLGAGANVDITDNKGRSALSIARSFKFSEIISLLGGEPEKEEADFTLSEM